MTRKPRKMPVREYKKDTFKAHQDKKVKGRELAIDGILVFLGKSQINFRNITKLAEHVCALLVAKGEPCDTTTLIRKCQTKDGTDVQNTYKLLLEKYMMGKYFGKGKNLNITAEDIVTVRRQFPAVDAYCAMKEGESKNLQERVKHLTQEVDFLQGCSSLPQANSVTCDSSEQLEKTVTALKRLVDAAEDIFYVDWQQRAIVDLAHRPPKVVVEPYLLSSFFSTLENCGMKPPEGV